MQRLGLIRKTFKYKTASTIKLLYTSLVRPVFEYTNSVLWCPLNKTQTNNLEKIQRRATKMVKGLRNEPYQTRVEKLKLLLLEQRRIRGDLIEFFKITKQLTEVSWINEPKFLTCSTRGHDKKFNREITKNCVQQVLHKSSLAALEPSPTRHCNRENSQQFQK